MKAANTLSLALLATTTASSRAMWRPPGGWDLNELPAEAYMREQSDAGSTTAQGAVAGRDAGASTSSVRVTTEDRAHARERLLYVHEQHLSRFNRFATFHGYSRHALSDEALERQLSRMSQAEIRNLAQEHRAHLRGEGRSR